MEVTCTDNIVHMWCKPKSGIHTDTKVHDLGGKWDNLVANSEVQV